MSSNGSPPSTTEIVQLLLRQPPSGELGHPRRLWASQETLRAILLVVLEEVPVVRHHQLCSWAQIVKSRFTEFTYGSRIPEDHLVGVARALNELIRLLDR